MANCNSDSKVWGVFSSKLPQNRHPERSASQIYRVTRRLGAESKDPEGAYLTHAALSFSTAEAGNWRTHHRLSLRPRTRTASISPWAAGTTAKILFSGFGGRKAPNSMGKISTLGVPSATLGTGSSTPRPSAVSRDKSVMRSAQDDVFVVSWRCKKQRANELPPAAVQKTYILAQGAGGMDIRRNPRFCMARAAG
jgi:hypothetical protein